MSTPATLSGSGIYRSLVILLSNYLSDASVEATLRTVLQRNGMTAADLTAEKLPEVVAEAMVGLRLFCDPRKLPDLMLDLADYCDDSTAALDRGLPPEQPWSEPRPGRRLEPASIDRHF